ncbi:hypothetical protein, partial [Streptomyces goshikiensis]|uniref:hypothetical protein n=1 Tax=Streptomyces goshikiensis TaxID=1942 RepID=UPI0033BBF98D
LDLSLLRDRRFVALCLVPVAGSFGFVTLLVPNLIRFGTAPGPLCMRRISAASAPRPRRTTR